MELTDNPVPSKDILDFETNCENLDILMNADQEYWTDRLGNKRPTIDYALRMAGFTPAGFDFATGGVLKNGDRNKCVFNQGDQTWYSWTGDLPYNVIAGSVPGEGWKVWDKNAYIIAYESICRSYAETGLIVKGLFATGEVVTSIADVLINPVDGKGYVYTGSYPHIVSENETPDSVGWGDKSKFLLTSDQSWGVHRTRNFISVADMIAAPGIRQGDTIIVPSFVAGTTLGGGEWKAFSSSDIPANGCTKLTSIGSPGITLRLIHTGDVNICQVGAIPGEDASSIINNLNNEPDVHCVYGAKKTFLCNQTVFLKKRFIGRGATFDFVNSPTNTDSFSAYNFPDDEVITDFTISNSKRVGLIGNGTGTVISQVRVSTSNKQGINWAGNDWEITKCNVNGVAREFGILNGGNSKRFKITKCVVSNVVSAGAYELGYQFSDCSITGCVALDSFAGCQIFPSINGAGTHVTMENVVINGFTSRNMSNAHIHIKNDYVADGIKLADVTIENPMLSGGSGTGIRAIYYDYLRILGGRIAKVGGWAAELLSSPGLVEFNSVIFDTVTGTIPFINTLKDDVIITECAFYNGDSVIGAPGSPTFANIIVSNCRTRNVTRPMINISELSVKWWRGNDFEVQFTSQGQLLGYYPVGYKRYFTNPTPGGFIGVVFTTGGVVGAGAVTKTFGPITA